MVGAWCTVYVYVRDPSLRNMNFPSPIPFCKRIRAALNWTCMNAVERKIEGEHAQVP